MAKNELSSNEATSIEAAENTFLALRDSNITEVIRENMGPRGIEINDLQRIRMPAGGGTAWEVETLTGVEHQKAITGVIIYHKDVRAYFDTPYTGEKNPPVCSSPDAITGHGVPGGSCDDCEFAKWGSKPGDSNGQACALRKMMLILPEGGTLPIIISAPPSSIGGVKKFFARLSNHSLKYFQVIVDLKLVKTKSSGGEYSVIDIETVRQLQPQEVAALVDYRDQLMPSFAKVRIEQDEVSAD